MEERQPRGHRGAEVRRFVALRRSAVKRVARRIVEVKKSGHDVVVAVSAMGDTTDELLDLAEGVSPLPPARELDMLLTAGERISMALVAMAISDLGFTARSFTGSQAGVITDSVHGKAKIIDVTPGRISAAIDDGHIVIVAGFQGVSQDTKEITTLGRGGTDTTAVALAAALHADVCEIYTDVDGVFTADPRIVPSARKLDRVTYEEMLELAACGAKILHLRCVEYARRYDIPIHVRSSFSQLDGTLVEGSINDEAHQEATMEQAIIAGVAHDRSEAKITVVGVPDKVGEAARIFDALAKAQINLDMIVQNVSAAATNLTDISFTLPRTDGATAMAALDALKDEIGFDSLLYDDKIGKVSLIGAGMRSHPGVTAKFFTAIAEAGVNIGMISTSEIRISVVVDEVDVDSAVAATHTAFDLDADEVEAVVYGGSGRYPDVSSPAALLPKTRWDSVSASSAPPARWASPCARSSSSATSRPTRSASSPPRGRPARCCRTATARSPSRTPPPPTRAASTSPCSRPVPPPPARRLRASPRPASRSSTTRRPSGWTPTCRWSSARSTRAPSPTRARGSSPTPTARPWPRCRCSSRCTTRPDWCG